MSRYKFTKKEIKIKPHDTDLEITLPNEDTVLIQFRPEGGTMDINFTKPTTVHNWMVDMKPAPMEKFKPPHAHIRRAIQLCVDLGDALEKK